MRILILTIIALTTLGIRAAAAQVHVNEAHLYFWEQAHGPLAPPAERHEAVVFDAAHSRLIGFNLALHHEAPGEAVTFPVACVYVTPDSTTIGPIPIDYQIPPTRGRLDEDGTPGLAMGHWHWRTPGTYLVQCSGGGNVLVEREFEMIAQPPALTEFRFYERQALAPRGPGPYATRFDAKQSRFLYTEVTFAFPAMDPEIARRLSGNHYGIRCWYIRPDGKPMRDFGIALQVDDSSGSGASGYEQPGNWVPGTYHTLCSSGGRIQGSSTFVMASDGAIADVWSTLSSPFPPSATDLRWASAVRVTQIRLFPTGSDLRPMGTRQYTTRFRSPQTARIAVELEFEHAPSGEAMKIPIACIYHLSDGQATNGILFPYEPEPDWSGGYSANGFGWDQPGQWPQGDYTAVCGIHGRPVAVERFSVVP